ncbi:hypothetical protein [Amycolatopsis jejuensis]|uniref:hypothetical protein n=1 Tax=Amycolatopsis jejuensis TaxID=330084 RepID=UPI0005258494|nr:hypothetical protein [Amycolatopsis jejuensis]
MTRIVDHIVLECSPADLAPTSALLQKAGFKLEDEVVTRGEGLQSHLLSIAGGGFIEMSAQIDPGSHKFDLFAHATPRLVVGAYTTGDGAADLAHMQAHPGGGKSFACCGGWQRTRDDSWGYYVGIMPTDVLESRETGVFFHLQDRRLFPLPYPHAADTAPALRKLTLTGSSAGLWRKRHVEFFDLPERDGSLWAGETELVFNQSEATDNQMVATFAVPNPEVEVPLAGGAFEFVPQH